MFSSFALGLKPESIVFMQTSTPKPQITIWSRLKPVMLTGTYVNRHKSYQGVFEMTAGLPIKINEQSRNIVECAHDA